MKTIDVRFSVAELNFLKGMVGKVLDKYKCDPFISSPSVYGIVGISVAGTSYAFTNFIEVADYFGDKEDVAFFKLRPLPYEQITSQIQDQEMMDTPVKCTIAEIMVVNERQRLYENDVLTYEVLLTRGVIFKFQEGNELSLEKNIWFSEHITVERGYDLIGKFSPSEEFAEGWRKPYRGEYTRELVILK